MFYLSIVTLLLFTSVILAGGVGHWLSYPPLDKKYFLEPKQRPFPMKSGVSSKIPVGDEEISKNIFGKKGGF
jgi:hypothetical protein